MEVDATPGKQSKKNAHKKSLSKEQETYKGGWEDLAWEKKKKKTANQTVPPREKSPARMSGGRS